jgi:hypothetical protein
MRAQIQQETDEELDSARQTLAQIANDGGKRESQEMIKYQSSV